MDPLDPLDAAMMTGELLLNPLHVAALLILSPPAKAGARYVDEVYGANLDENIELDPRLRRYPHRGLDTGGMWVWRDAETVDLREHIERRSLPARAGQDELWKLVGQLHAQPLDRSRPMWKAYLIDGLKGGRYAFYVKIHHTVVDGVAGFQMIADSLTTDPNRRSIRPFYASRPKESPDGTGAAAGHLPNPIALVRSAVSAAASTAGLTRQVIEGELSNLAAALTKDTGVLPLEAPYTRFNGRPGHERSVAGASWAKSRIRAVQDAARVTGNDVVTAVVAGVLRSWLIAHEELPKKSLVAICPITVRARGREHGADEGEHGNMFGAELCPLGTDLADPSERLALIHRTMSWAKQQVASRGPGATMLLLAPSIAPTVLLPMVPFAPRLRTGYNLPISNVPGPQTEMYWNGAHIEEIYPVSTVYDGMGLNVTVCSYADRVTFGYVAGREMLPDIETLIPLTERALDELETAVGVAP
ncbi:MAG: wax ester/triacylglycerol synthase family O-acyltransferase [Mycobacterium sp.]|uniref:wax ester/triacylglycerol synthase family O-acyltransferase n=1 Tax=Mycobacterium sp. TaxID=1785 RepID=UPI003F9834F1